MKTILVVDDTDSLRIMIKKYLSGEGFRIVTAKNGREAIFVARDEKPDLIILDLMMPEMDGYDFMRVYGREADTPIIILTAKLEEGDKVLGLELGADDYIIKPFSLRELLARVKAVLRRTESTTAAPEKQTIGNITFDFQRYEAFENGEQVKLSHKEFEIVHHLWDNRNTIVSRDQLLREVWNYESQPTTRTVDNFILKIRQKIEENPNSPKYILTVHGSGYKLVI